MSASLVGSEMCIRDRGFQVHAVWQDYGSPSVLHPGLPGEGGSSSGGRPPVSYTHLTLPTICSV
eukprot:1060947-Alexandrium_andersonii.AAC.1